MFDIIIPLRSVTFFPIPWQSQHYFARRTQLSNIWRKKLTKLKYISCPYHANKQSLADLQGKSFLFSGNCRGHAFSLTSLCRKSRKGWCYFVSDRDSPRAAKHEAFSQTKEVNGLQLPLKTEVLRTFK